MRAYLDNCLIVDIENEEIDINRLRAETNVSQFVYSITHLFEAKLRNDLNSELIAVRCELLHIISNDSYIQYNPRIKQNEVIYCNPLTEYYRIHLEHINQILESLPQLEPLMGMIRSMEEFPLKPIENNNLDAKDFLSKLNALWLQILGMNFKEFIKTNLPVTAHNLPFDVNKVVECIILYHLIDELGYYSDKKGKSRSRMFDSLHIYFSCECDLFITSDRNSYKKAQVVYEYYNVNTKAIHLKI